MGEGKLSKCNLKWVMLLYVNKILHYVFNIYLRQRDEIEIERERERELERELEIEIVERERQKWTDKDRQRDREIPCLLIALSLFINSCSNV